MKKYLSWSNSGITINNSVNSEICNEVERAAPVRPREVARNGNLCYAVSMNRREYQISIIVNEIQIDRVIIDPHYEEKHVESINDKIILDLVQMLDGKIFEPDDEKTPYCYFVTDKIELEGKFYKLIWLLEDHEIYIGVINAYRR